MVLLRKTEIKYKKLGFYKAKDIYDNKISEQKKIYDKRIKIYEKNLEKKDALISKLLKEIEEDPMSEDKSNVASVLTRCVNILRKDIEITLSKNADAIIEAKQISTDITPNLLLNAKCEVE